MACIALLRTDNQRAEMASMDRKRTDQGRISNNHSSQTHSAPVSGALLPKPCTDRRAKCVSICMASGPVKRSHCLDQCPRRGKPPPARRYLRQHSLSARPHQYRRCRQLVDGLGVHRGKDTLCSETASSAPGDSPIAAYYQPAADNVRGTIPGAASPFMHIELAASGDYPCLQP